jgi:hypothetical protein
VKKRVFKYFSEAGGFRVEDQGLSFPYGGNSERLRGLLGRRRPRGTAFFATTCTSDSRFSAFRFSSLVTAFTARRRVRLCPYTTDIAWHPLSPINLRVN